MLAQQRGRKVGLNGHQLKAEAGAFRIFERVTATAVTMAVTAARWKKRKRARVALELRTSAVLLPVVVVLPARCIRNRPGECAPLRSRN